MTFFFVQWNVVKMTLCDVESLVLQGPRGLCIQAAGAVPSEGQRKPVLSGRRYRGV